ncbi:MAG TPA: NUDIX hydrolase [Clostridiales bacterium]|nr:NUDIX hydrolase [Clostridiales bacterium]
MLPEEKTIRTKKIYEGKIIHLRVDEVELPGGKSSTREIVEHPGAVAIVPVTEDGEIIMVRQFRKAADMFLLEIPAGKLDKNEDPLSCAKRELKEETGYEAQNIELLGSFYSSPGFSNELIHIYIATDLIPGEASPDENEYLSVEKYTIDQLLEMIRSGNLKDGKTIIGVMAAKLFFAG